MDYEKMPLLYLQAICSIGDKLALNEWKRRWENDYPSMGKG